MYKCEGENICMGQNYGTAQAMTMFLAVTFYISKM